jgi:tetratricopeptide (TPR) repeat protein
MTIKTINNKSIFKIIIALFLALTLHLNLTSVKGFAPTSNRAILENKISFQDEFDKKFREGRDLMDKEEWAKAAEKFTEIINKYPQNNAIDASLYWLAFCQKKQKQFKEVAATIDRLIRDFPSSSWADDAKVMKLEISYPVATGSFSTTTATNIPRQYPTATNIFGSYSNSEFYATTITRFPLEREDEIRLAAFQSLMSANPKRGIEILNQIFQPESKASENFKIIVLQLAPRTSNNNNILATTKKPEENPLNPILKETLYKIFQKETNVKIRKEVIWSLGYLSDYQSLTEILKTEKTTDLRNAALINLQRSKGWTANAEFIQNLSDIYNSETSDEFKISIISTLVRINQPQSIKKLLDIAKTEKSDKLKLEAIRALGKSKDPEALKYLEELIK